MVTLFKPSTNNKQRKNKDEKTDNNTNGARLYDGEFVCDQLD